MKTNTILVAALMSAGLLTAQSAMAEPILGNTYQLDWGGRGGWNGYGYVNAKIYNTVPTHPVGGNPTAVGVGGSTMYNVKDVTTGENLTPNMMLEAFCVDIFNWLQPSHNYIYETGQTFFNNASMVGALGRLAANHLSDITNATSSAAFQLAVWEIVNEESPTAWNTASGDFYANPYNGSNIAAARDLANTWLASNANETNSMSVYVYRSSADAPQSQSMVVFAQSPQAHPPGGTPAPVPEPASLALLSLGLVGVAVSRRTKRRA